MNFQVARFHRAALLVTVAALTLVLGLPAIAQSAAAAPAAAVPAAVSSGGRVGIVNIQQAIVTSNEGQRDFAELQKKFDPKRQELEALNREIEELQKKFNTQAEKLNDEARADLLKQIDSKKKLMQRSYEDANADVQTQQNEIANRIGQKLISVLDKYAKEHDFSVVLDVSGQGSPVLWASASVDITKPVIDAYNAQSGVPAPVKSSSAAPAAPATPAAAIAAKPAAPAPATNGKPVKK
jgi:Skp family chaperone for outer membrane proteins